MNAALRITATSLALLLPVAAASEPVGVPDPRFSSFEAVVIGCPSGTAIPGCSDAPLPAPGHQVVVRDINNSTLVGVSVTLNFSATTMRLFTDTRPGTTFNCIARTITRVTDGSGTVTFSPRLGGALRDGRHDARGLRHLRGGVRAQDPGPSVQLASV
jgi:hypothetical protein